MAEAIDINKLIIQLLSSDKYLREVERMNRERLYNTGKDAKGKEIETFSKFGSIVYAYYTIREKERLNLPTDRVTGYMTGKLHESITATANEKFIEILADEQRYNLFIENIATDETNILGLTDENIETLGTMLKEDLPNLFIENLTEEKYIDTDIMQYHV